MRTARHREAAVLAALLWAGCAARPGPVDHARSAPEPPGVAVLMHGTAFAQHGPRDEAVQLVRDLTARAAHALTDEPPMEPVLQAAAARLDKSVARAARAGARDVTCRKKGRAAVTAVAEHAEMLLRIQLDATVRSHDATAEERTELAPKAGLDGMLSSMGLDGNNTVYETTLDGTIERTTFPGSTTVVKHRVRWSGRRLGPRDDATPPSVRDALARALGAMPTASPPRWDALARGFVTSGCPVVGTAVADAFAGDEAAKRRVRAAATGALGPIAKREEPSVPPTELAAAPPVEPAAGDPAPADPAPAPVPDTPEPALSCPSLCTLHMVELCNNDRTLWSQHGSRWESSRCGVRRSETFLEDCYRMQWLSGTYEQSCIRPCEESAEGRTRLVAMLRRSGCLRTAS